MKKKSFIEKYGSLSVSFVQAYKHRFTYKGCADGVDFTISDTAEYRDEMNATENVCSFDEDADVYYGGEYLQ